VPSLKILRSEEEHFRDELKSVHFDLPLHQRYIEQADHGERAEGQRYSIIEEQPKRYFPNEKNDQSQW
jgi:hypothetical protein